MKFLSRLLNGSKTPDEPEMVTCPRCLGKGHVDEDDIARLKQQGKWRTGACAYCKGTGIVDETMKIVAAQMEVPFEKISLVYYEDRVSEEIGRAHV